MTTALVGFVGSLGVALIITALTLPDRKSKEVIDSVAWGATHVVEGVLGQKP
jgi:hypothetical protein